ncbi:unnamed protein product [Rotaria sp. Silwood1]|nr:unnamed protein product [Rotaria sp. Silwood1]
MSNSNQINNNETDIDHDKDSRFDSGTSSSGFSTPNSNSDQKYHISVQTIVSSLLCQRIIKRCKSIIKVRRFSNLEEANKQLFMLDNELET